MAMREISGPCSATIRSNGGVSPFRIPGGCVYASSCSTAPLILRTLGPLITERSVGHGCANPLSRAETWQGQCLPAGKPAVWNASDVYCPEKSGSRIRVVEVVPGVGLEPTTYRLQGGCSTS